MDWMLRWAHTNQKSISQKLTPPSRMRRGSILHSSWTALSSHLNQWSSRFPSHQSAVWSMLILLENINFRLFLIIEKIWPSDYWSIVGHWRKSGCSPAMIPQWCRDPGLVRYVERVGRSLFLEWQSPLTTRELSFVRRSQFFLPLGPEISMLWIVIEGSRQQDERTDAGFWVTADNSSYNSFSSAVCGRTLSSIKNRLDWKENRKKAHKSLVFGRHSYCRLW